MISGGGWNLARFAQGGESLPLHAFWQISLNRVDNLVELAMANWTNQRGCSFVSNECLKQFNSACAHRNVARLSIGAPAQPNIQ